jgi:hypothetical protein
MTSHRSNGACPLFPTIRQAAHHTGCSERWLRDQVRRGVLPIYQIEPGSWPRICLEELVAMIRATRRDDRPMDAAERGTEVRP